MTKQEHILNHLSEECVEISHRVSKALRFGLEEKQKGQELTNAERIEEEIADLFGIINILEDEKILKRLQDYTWLKTRLDAKKEKVLRYLEYSKSLGTLQ